MIPSLSKIKLCFKVMLCSFIFMITIPPSIHAGNPPESASLDSDHDGVVDTQDKCPNTLQVFKVDPNSRIAPLFEPKHLEKEIRAVTVDIHGCAMDRDKDGVPDHQDYCPDDTLQAISAGVSEHGCPLQSDGDGTPDFRDKCPGTLQGISTDQFGCPKKYTTLR
jgi:OmpA-OmpF porin, OOP family